MSSVVFRPRNHPWDKSQVEIVLGRTVPGDVADSSCLGGDQTGVLTRRRKTGESRRIVTIAGRRCDFPESQSCRSGLMVRWRRVDRATGDTLRGGRGKGQRTISRPERARVISWTRPRHPNSPWRSQSDSWKRKNTWQNPVGDPTWRQGGKGCGVRNVRGFPSMEWSSRSDEGRPRRYDDQGSRYQTVAWGRENILPQYIAEHKTQLDSIQKTGISFNRKKMNGRTQINGRGFHRWCFMADVWR